MAQDKKQTVQEAFDLIKSIYTEIDTAAFPKQANDESEAKVGKEKKHASQSGKASDIENAKDQHGPAPVAKGQVENDDESATTSEGPDPISTKKKPEGEPRKVAAMSDADTQTDKTAMAQKIAQADRLSDVIVGILKDASEGPAEAMDDLQKEALDRGSEYAYFYYLGRKTRQEHSAELASAGIKAEVLEKVGGIDGLLDKAAEADPAAVLPPELAAAAAQEGAGDDEAALEQIAQVLADSGVTAEELDQMIQQISALKEQGMTDEQIMQALSELADETGAAGEGAPETDAQEAAEAPEIENAETAAQEASEHPEKTASIQKTAEQYRAGVDIAKAFLRNGGK